METCKLDGERALSRVLHQLGVHQRNHDWNPSRPQRLGWLGSSRICIRRAVHARDWAQIDQLWIHLLDRMVSTSRSACLTLYLDLSPSPRPLISHSLSQLPRLHGIMPPSNRRVQKSYGSPKQHICIHHGAFPP